MEQELNSEKLSKLMNDIVEQIGYYKKELENLSQKYNQVEEEFQRQKEIEFYQSKKTNVNKIFNEFYGVNSMKSFVNNYDLEREFDRVKVVEEKEFDEKVKKMFSSFRLVALEDKNLMREYLNKFKTDIIDDLIFNYGVYENTNFKVLKEDVDDNKYSLSWNIYYQDKEFRSSSVFYNEQSYLISVDIIFEQIIDFFTENNTY